MTMNVSASVGSLRAIQNALHVLAALELTAHMWPPHATVQENESFDFIVVGAGTGGSVVANRLTEDSSVNVLLIEAGGDPPFETTLPTLMVLMKKSGYDWNYTAIPNTCTDKCHNERSSEIIVGKMLGGTSSLGYLIHSQGNKNDYEEWSKIANDPTWNWNGVLPYFIKSETENDNEILQSQDKELHGTKGPVGTSIDHHSDDSKFLAAFEELGHLISTETNAQHTLGYSPLSQELADGVRQSAAYAYLRPIKRRPNLKVLKNTIVKKVLFDASKNAIGVEAVTANGEPFVVKAKREVIVSAGAINSPQLLMLSGVGPKVHLQEKNIELVSDLPVGDNLQDHSMVTLILKMENVKSSSAPVLDPHIYPAATLIGYTALDKSQDYPDYQTLSFINYKTYLMQFCSFNYNFNDDICESIFGGDSKKFLYNLILGLHPTSRGSIRLKSSDYRDQPDITTTYCDKKDLDMLVKYLEDFVKVVDTSFFKALGAVIKYPKINCDAEPGTTEYWKCYVKCMWTSMGHHVGTCPMGSVVDSRLRVLGVQGLRVVDASVMPTITRGNTNGPVFMIAEKAADMIKEDNNLL